MNRLELEGKIPPEQTNFLLDSIQKHLSIFFLCDPEVNDWGFTINGIAVYIKRIDAGMVIVGITGPEGDWFAPDPDHHEMGNLPHWAGFYHEAFGFELVKEPESF
jgi:hypothetical protein